MNKNIEVFRNEVIEALAREGIMATVSDTIKNGVVSHCVRVIPAPTDDDEKHGRLCPNIALDTLTHIDIDKIVDKIKYVLENNENINATGYRAEPNFEKVWLFLSRGEAEDVILREFKDGLSYGVRVYVDLPDGDFGSIKLTESYCKMYGKDVDELFEKAKKNLHESVKICSMEETIRRIAEENGFPTNAVPILFPMEDSGMFVATTANSIDGGAILTDNEALEKFREEHGDFWILPSSIHELIFVPCNRCPDNKESRDHFSSMINDVNVGTVPDGEVLSNSLFKFDADGLRVIEG